MTKNIATPAVKSGIPGSPTKDAKPARKPAEPESALAHDGDDSDDSADLDAPAIDVTLDETRRILIDYIRLLDKASGVAVTRPARPAGPAANR